MNSQEMHIHHILDFSWSALGVIDTEGNILFANQAFIPILGYDLAELQALNLFDLVVDKKQDLLKTIELLCENNFHNIKLKLKRKDSIIVYLDISFSYVEENSTIVLNAKDITSEVSYDEVVGDFIISCKLNLDGKILKISNMFCQISEYEKDELIGQDFEVLVATIEDRKKVFDHLLSKEEQTFTIEGIGKNSQKFWLKSIIRPIKNKYGDTIGFNNINFDITDSVKLKHSNENLELKINEAVEKNRKKDQIIFNQSKLAIMGEMLTTMSHHWRQPLNTISLKAQGLALKYEFSDHVARDTAIPFLDDIENESDRLSEILQEFQKSISVKKDGEFKNIENIVVDAMQIIENNPLNTKVHFFQNFFDVSSKEIFPIEFVNVLVNIMINSLEAFQRNKIVEPVIDLNLSCDEEDAYLEIIDNGGGIDEEILPKVFEPYFSTKSEKNGTGLGLYMAKNIIEIKMMGSIEIDTISNHAKVFIQIPLNQDKVNGEDEL
jgi:PAS domain S-box-containing protein